MVLTICGVLSDTLFCYFAELVQIKSTPTDSELAVQIDETESKVRAPTGIHRVHYFVLHNHTHLMHYPYPYTHTIFFLSFRNRSPNSANTSSLCARARRSSQQPSLTLWTPSGLNGVPNGSSEEKYSTSALALFSFSLSRLLRERPHAPTDVFFSYGWKVSGHSLPTHCPHLMLSNSQKILGSSTIRLNISS